MQETAVPTVPVDGQVTVAPSARGATVTVADAGAVFAFASVTVRVTVKVPFVVYVWVGFAVVPVALPSPKFHA